MRFVLYFGDLWGSAGHYVGHLLLLLLLGTPHHLHVADEFGEGVWGMGTRIANHHDALNRLGATLLVLDEDLQVLDHVGALVDVVRKDLWGE